MTKQTTIDVTGALRVKYAPHEVLFWSFFKVCPYKVDILLQVFPVILKNLRAQCSN